MTQQWRWTGFDDRPDWVLACTELRDNNELFLVRRSGKQIVRVRERVAIEAGEVVHLGSGE